jgi:hypothetical protein
MFHELTSVFLYISGSLRWLFSSIGILICSVLLSRSVKTIKNHKNRFLGNVIYGVRCRVCNSDVIYVGMTTQSVHERICNQVSVLCRLDCFRALEKVKNYKRSNL